MISVLHTHKSMMESLLKQLCNVDMAQLWTGAILDMLVQL